MEGLMNNEKGNQIAERIKKVMEIAKDRAITITRTEGNRANNYGTLDGAIQAPIKLKKWLSTTKDNRISPICDAMGKKYGSPEKAIPLDEDFVVEVKGEIHQGPSPPFHPNCRSVLMMTQ